MTVSTTNRKNDFSTNGVTVDFPFTFAVTDSEQVKALTVDAEGLEVDYINFTVSLNTATAGGTLTTGDVLDGVTLIVYRLTQLTQNTDYVGGGRFPAASHEQALDKLTLQNQDQQEEIDRALKYDIGTDISDVLSLSDYDETVNVRDEVTLKSANDYTDNQVIEAGAITPGNINMFAGGKPNLLSNHNFLIASPDDSQPAPGATPTSYPSGYEIFSGVFANETTGILNLTYIDGRVSFSGGDFYMSVTNTGALENITEFVASVADFDGKPRTRGVSFSLVGDEYRVTVGVDALEDESANETLLGSVKFEQGSVATGHSVQSAKGQVYTFNSVADAVTNCPPVGSKLIVEDYYGGVTPNNSGVLFFKVVPAGAGVDDGGKYIDIPGGIFQLEQNVRLPADPRAWGAMGDGARDDTESFNNPLALYDDLHAGAGEYMIDAVTGITLMSGKTVTGTDSTTLRVIPNDQKNHRIFWVDDTARHVTIDNFRIVGDRYEHIGTIGEAGHGVQVRHGARYVKLRNLYITDMWGDGIYIGGGDSTSNAQYVLISNCTAQNCRRQGSSITAGQDIYYEFCTFRDTNGTLPECGVDLEPNTVDGVGQTVERITFESCNFIGNNNSGANLDANSALGDGEFIREIKFSNCRFYDNASRGVLLLGGVSNVTIQSSFIYKNGGYGIGVFNSSGENSDIIIDACKAYGNARINLYIDRITGRISVTSSSFGGVDRVDDFSVYARQTEDFAFTGNRIYGQNFGLKLSGTKNTLVEGNYLQNIPYTALEISDSGSSYNAIKDNTFLNCGYSSDADDALGRYKGTPVHLRAGTSYCMFKNNMFLGVNSPRDAFYCFQDANVLNNKVLYDTYKSNSTAKERRVNNASPTNQIVTVDSLFTDPWV